MTSPTSPPASPSPTGPSAYGYGPEAPRDEITLRELVVRGRQLLRVARRRWVVGVLLAGAGAAAAGLYAYASPVAYRSDVTYLVNDGGGGGGGAGAILQQFGFNLGSPTDHNLDQIIAISRSQRLVKSVLLDSTDLLGAPAPLANVIAEVEGLEMCNEEERERGLERCPALGPAAGVPDGTFSPEEVRRLHRVYGAVAGGDNSPGLMTSDYDEVTGILKLAVSSASPALSDELARRLYAELSDFYSLEMTEKERRTYRQIDARVDSIQRLVEGLEYRIAGFDDASRGLVTRQARLQRERNARELSMMRILLGEGIKNRETASFVVANVTPFFSVVDGTDEPPVKLKKSVLLYGVLGGLIGGVLFGLHVVYLEVKQHLDL